MRIPDDVLTYVSGYARGRGITEEQAWRELTGIQPLRAATEQTAGSQTAVPETLAEAGESARPPAQFSEEAGGIPEHLQVNPIPAPVAKNGHSASRQPKADLWDLRKAGLLIEGQTLHLRDYRGAAIPGAEATLSGVNKLAYKGGRYSMSALASELLMKAGFQAYSVRGPAHWYTEDGRSVKQLWEHYLASRKNLSHA